MSKRHKHKNKPKVYAGYGWHKEPKEAFKLGKCQRPVIGGSFAAMGHKDWALLLCCNGRRPEPIVSANAQALQLLPRLSLPAPSPFISIDWADLQAPDLDREFWISLVSGLLHLGKPGPIGVCCVGGTGRTGTALAIIAQLAGLVPDGQCPVAFIRQHYVKDAVEAREQGEYIQEITGAKVTTVIEPPYTYADSKLSLPSVPVSYPASEPMKCIHGKPMHLFCPDCMGKSGGISNYRRDW